MMKKLAHSLIVTMMLLGVNISAEDTCLGKNMGFRESGYEEINPILKAMHPNLRMNIVLAMAEPGTCSAETINGRLTTTTIDDVKLKETAFKVINIMQTCQDQQIFSGIDGAANPYLLKGKCFIATQPTSRGAYIGGAELTLIQKLGNNSGLYSYGSKGIVFYKSKKPIEEHLTGIIKVSGDYQYQTNYGINIVPKVEKVADLQDKIMNWRVEKKPMTALEAVIQRAKDSQKQ